MLGEWVGGWFLIPRLGWLEATEAWWMIYFDYQHDCQHPDHDRSRVASFIIWHSMT